MKAVIMAGGEGTRLRPLTATQPKPLLPMANRPMMERVVELLKTHGFDEIVVTVAFLANSIRRYFGDGSEFGVRMVYATEETPMGTAGSVLNAREELTERFLVVSGDILTDIDLSEIVRFHDGHGALATIGLKSMDNPLEFGIVITRDDGTVERFLEKPTWGQVFSDTVNTGIYVLDPEIFEFIAAGRPVDFSADVFPAILDKGLPLYGDVVEGYWEDVGTLGAYLKAHRDILDGRVAVSVEGFELRPSVWLGEGVEVDPTAEIDGPAVIGDNCRIGPGVRLSEYCVLGDDVQVGANARLQRSVVHAHSYLGTTVHLRGTVLGRSCDLRQGVGCEEGVVLGDECFVGAHAQLKSDVKVYPFKTVESGAIINSSIVWESRGARSLFGREGVQGLANVDISPELVLRLSMAYASTLPRGSTVVASRDSSRAARVLKRAVMVGCNAAGVNVDDLEVSTVPVTRYQVKGTAAHGGISVRLSQEEHDTVVVRFFDARGIDIDETMQRKIERLYYREDLRRVPAKEIGEIGFPPRTIEFYTAELVGSLDLEKIQQAHFKVVLDYAYGTSSFVMPNVLAKLGADVLVVNPYASTAGTVGFDARLHAARVAELVRASAAHVGAVIGPDGEHLTLVDDAGHIISDDEALMVLLTVVLASNPGGTVAMPVSVSRGAERICGAAGATIVWTKLSTSSLMEAASSGRVDFAASQMGGFIFPRFLPAYDATATLVNLLAILAEKDLRLSSVVRGLPEVHIAHQEVVTPWDHKGTLMRQFVEHVKGREMLLVDGVKVIDAEGWVLVLPDPEEPLTHVWAEDETEASARSKAQEHAVRLRQMLQ